MSERTDAEQTVEMLDLMQLMERTYQATPTSKNPHNAFGAMQVQWQAYREWAESRGNAHILAPLIADGVVVVRDLTGNAVSAIIHSETFNSGLQTEFKIERWVLFSEPSANVSFSFESKSNQNLKYTLQTSTFGYGNRLPAPGIPKASGPVPTNWWAVAFGTDVRGNKFLSGVKNAWIALGYPPWRYVEAKLYLKDLKTFFGNGYQEATNGNMEVEPWQEWCAPNSSTDAPRMWTYAEAVQPATNLNPKSRKVHVAWRSDLFVPPPTASAVTTAAVTGPALKSDVRSWADAVKTKLDLANNANYIKFYSGTVKIYDTIPEDNVVPQG